MGRETLVDPGPRARERDLIGGTIDVSSQSATTPTRAPVAESVRG
jgi:hypothetical protein